MLICVVAVALQWSYPSALSIDIEITVLFAWPLVAVARAGECFQKNVVLTTIKYLY